MISEESCDDEDWSNDAGNTASHHRNNLHFNRYSNRNGYLNCTNISVYFWSNKYSIGGHKISPT